MKNLLSGAVPTIQLTLLGAALAFLLSFLGGFGRLSRFTAVRGVSGFIVEFFRGTSLLVQLFWLFYVLPFMGIRLESGMVGLLALGFNYGAYGSEVVRSAILSVPQGQHEAGISLNMTSLQRMRYIILPQAFRTMIPSFGNLLIELLKGTALVSLVTIPEMTFEALAMRTNDAQYTLEIFGWLLVIYFAISYPLTMLMRWTERRFSLGRL
ncbi:polar amino acid transport system permease protein [Marininema mesophilum]|uniref:Polar amino acid transport system permease protein n=1 Tax=Marininema mesophilum TaxID=1048340 RepID=A0A1H2V9A1_9BACL|nr:polar amino acid transport system permease protein [Marininema mesophilum]